MSNVYNLCNDATVMQTIVNFFIFSGFMQIETCKRKVSNKRDQHLPT